MLDHASEEAEATVAETLRAALGPHFGEATISVEDAGQLLGLGRSSAYDAVARGDIPAIRIGRRRVVPVPALARMLLGESDGGASRAARLFRAV